MTGYKPDEWRHGTIHHEPDEHFDACPVRTCRGVVVDGECEQCMATRCARCGGWLPKIERFVDADDPQQCGCAAEMEAFEALLRKYRDQIITMTQRNERGHRSTATDQIHIHHTREALIRAFREARGH